ncbi:MAG: thioesterase family protein [Aestuariivita sp.]|uniref:acyl-CoA thioesterase n=1 Tax=Aestuariivita sp. TaxID=1872407 RepID=UPI003BAEBED6
MPFDYHQKVLFKHCDPAGIVFYPRYFEMINDATEAFFDEALGCPWEILHETANIPTVEITTRFSAPSRHGDALIIRLEVTRLGRSSLGLRFQATCGGETRFVANSTLVRIAKTGRPEPWPDNLRTKITSFLGDTA